MTATGARTTDRQYPGLLLAGSVALSALPFGWLASRAPLAAAAVAAAIVPLVATARATAKGRGEWLLLVLFACVAFSEFLPDLLEIPGFRMGPEKLVILLGVLCLLVWGALHEEWPFPKHPASAPAILACVLAFAHAILAPEQDVAMRKATSLSALVLMAHVVAGLAQRCDRAVLLAGLAWILLAVGILSLVLYGLGVTLDGEPAEGGRATGSLHNPNEWGAFCVLGLPFLLCLGLDDAPRRGKRLWVVASVVLVVSVALSFSRGAFVALAMVTVVALLKAKRRRFLPLLALGLTLVLAGDALPLERVMSRFLTLLNPSTEIGDSLSLRAGYLDAGLRLFAESPFFGCGLGHFPLQAHRISDVMPGFDAHNTFITILSETGIAGAVVGAWFLLALASHLSGRGAVRPPEVRGVAFGLLGLLFMGFSGTLHLESYVWFWIGCAMGFSARKGNAR